jgi:glyoxylase-like metal-dependent hydrolase (beta-lactamase superfamily II)
MGVRAADTMTMDSDMAGSSAGTTMPDCRNSAAAWAQALVRLARLCRDPTPRMANPLESELHYVLGDALPDSGRTLPVAEGVRWLRMRLPFALDHINLWLLRDRLDGREGWTVVDCGIDNGGTRAAWERIFTDELQGLPVLRVICTHMHPDHIGLAHWLCERWQCRLWISATDWNAARVASSAAGDAHSGHAAADFYARHGMADPAALEQLRARPNLYASMVPRVPEQFRRLLHGMRLRIGSRDWHCIAGYGHAPEHIALHCPDIDAAPEAPAAPTPPAGAAGLGAARRPAGVLISGDMVLPRISTNISVHDIEPEANPLPLYLESIAAMRALPAETLVLPSHGKPFTGLHRRIGQLQGHHDERLAEVLQACGTVPRSAAELLPLMFKRELDAHQTTFALGEAVAHVNALLEAGRLRSVPHADGVLRFARTG